MTRNPVKVARPVALVGISDHSQRIIEMVFSMQGKDRYRLAGALAPQAAIVDLDSTNADRVWGGFRASYPDLPAVIIAMQPEPRPGAIILKKPVTPQGLIDALDRLSYKPEITESEPEPVVPARTKVVARGASAPPAPSTRSTIAAMEDEVDAALCNGVDVNLLDPDQVATVSFESTHRLLNVCRQAIQMVRDTGAPHSFVLGNLGHPLYFLPDHGGQVVSRLGDNQLRSLCLVSINDSSIAIAPVLLNAHETENLTPVGFESFIWNIALCTSRGRLPEGTSLIRPLRLKRWPNFTRVRETPHAMSLSALWTSTSISLFDTCKTFGIPQRYVFAFYCAAEAAGLIEWATESSAGDDASRYTDRRTHVAASAPVTVATPVPPERRGLFGRILSHLMH